MLSGFFTSAGAGAVLVGHLVAKRGEDLADLGPARVGDVDVRAPARSSKNLIRQERGE